MPGGTRAVRLRRSESGADRLMAESAALGLLAHWLAPLVDDGPMGDGAPGAALGCAARRGVARVPRVPRVADMLLSDLCHPPSLERLAVAAGMSHTRLNRCFCKVCGQTVFAWLRDRPAAGAR